MYHFITGYTAKVAGTEVGVKDPEETFSACFGQAFLPLHPYVYADLLAKKMEEHSVNVWLVNTGWTGGRYGVGKRMSLRQTRAIVDAIHDGSLEQADYKTTPVFNLRIPTQVKGVPDEILNPKNTWQDKAAYDEQVKKLAQKFVNNFKKFEDKVPKSVLEMGGPTVQ